MYQPTVVSIDRRSFYIHVPTYSGLYRQVVLLYKCMVLEEVSDNINLLLDHAEEILNKKEEEGQSGIRTRFHCVLVCMLLVSCVQ